MKKVAKALDVSFNNILELNAEAILNNNNQTGGLNQWNTAPTYNYLKDKNI